MRRLGADAVTESYIAILDAPAGKQVVVRRVIPAIQRDATRISGLRTRLGDLQHLRPSAAIAKVLETREVDGELFIVEEQPDGVELTSILASAAALGLRVPHNVFLHLAAQLCNGLEAMHSQVGVETGSEHVLHLALSPESIWVTADGRVTLGRYGLTRSPTALATQSTGSLPAGIEYLSPEQTHLEQKLLPASDLFSLGAVLFELLTLQPLFRAETNLQTIHRLRRAEVTTQLLEVKELLPGLDKVLFRSLSLNPRHRYQRAFVLREDLRGLMAGFSFSDIDVATREFLEPAIAGIPEAVVSVDGSTLGRGFHASGSSAAKENTAALLRGVPDGTDDGSPTSEPREFTPLNPPPRDTAIGEDTGALLGGDTNTFARSAGELNRPPGEDTAWTANKDAALGRAGRVDPLDLPSRPLEAIDTARRTRDDLSSPPPVRTPLPGDLELVGQDARGDTLPMAFENTRPGDEGTHTGPSGWPMFLPPAMGPPSSAPEPALARRTPAPAPDRLVPGSPAGHASGNPSSGNLASGDVVPISAEVPLDPPFDFASSLADDTGLHPLRRGAGRPDLTATAPGPFGTPMGQEVTAAPRDSGFGAGRLGPPDSLVAPATPAPQTLRVAPTPPQPRRVVSVSGYDLQDAEEPSRSLMWPIAGLVVVAITVAAAVFLCVGGGGVLGLVGLGRTSAGPTAELDTPAPPPPPEEPPAAPEPVPEPVVAEPAPAPLVAPAVEPVVVAAAPTPRQRDLDLDLRPSAPSPAKETFEAVAATRPRSAPRPPPAPPPSPRPPPTSAPAPRPAPEVAPAAAPALVSSELDAWSPDAFAGRLGGDSRARLSEVPVENDDFSRAQTLLFLDAKARGDTASRDRSMDALMAKPENRYNPALLVELAEIRLQRRQWDLALEAARKAEQHWGRLPSELVWSRKTMMYELQALAFTGRFYDSEGDDLDALTSAISNWERYQRHVTAHDRADLENRAAQNLTKLRGIQARLPGAQP